MSEIYIYLNDDIKRRDLSVEPKNNNYIGSNFIEFLLDQQAKIFDASFDSKKPEVMEFAIAVLESVLDNDQLSDKQIIKRNFFLATAYSNLILIKQNSSDIDVWESEETDKYEKSILRFRKALKIIDNYNLEELDSDLRLLKTRIYVNLGNVLSNLGRVIEGLEYSKLAQETDPEYGMPQGSRGNKLFSYALSLYDPGHQDLILKFSHYYCKQALTKNLDSKENAEIYEKVVRYIESDLNESYLNTEYDMDSFSLGDSDDERNYRKWCLDNNLFINPLNELGSYPIAACDELTLPSFVIEKNEWPIMIDFFNQIKQEYASARYLFYESLRRPSSHHFSDNDVKLIDLLDYSVYSLLNEKMKISFRVMYSIFDKIAFVLNYYMTLEIPPEKVNFSKIWYIYNKNKKKFGKDLSPNFTDSTNTSLKALFWLSKDLYEYTDDGYYDSIEPDAKNWHEIRNYMEHRCVKIVEHPYGPPSKISNGPTKNDLMYTINFEEFRQSNLKFLKLTRAAIIYLCMAIHQEEVRRERIDPKIAGPIEPSLIDDETKY